MALIRSYRPISATARSSRPSDSVRACAIILGFMGLKAQLEGWLGEARHKWHKYQSVCLVNAATRTSNTQPKLGFILPESGRMLKTARPA